MARQQITTFAMVTPERHPCPAQQVSVGLPLDSEQQVSDVEPEEEGGGRFG